MPRGLRRANARNDNVPDGLISRRAFGQAIGTAAMGASMPTVCAASSLSPVRGRGQGEGERGKGGGNDRPQRGRARGAHATQAALGARGDGGAPGADRAREPEGQRHRHARRRAGAWPMRRGRTSAPRAAEPLGPLHGLPVAHKDLVDTAGIRTTRGSPFYRDHVPTRDALIVDAHARGRRDHGRQDQHAGVRRRVAHLQHGLRRHAQPVRPRRRPAAAAAAARPWRSRCGMVPIADGSDTGGSLRNPAAFCNVVGFRPSPGRVPSEIGIAGRRSRSPGPMARIGRRRRAVPQRHRRTRSAQRRSSINEDGARFARPLGRDFKGVRVAWWRGLGGIPFEPEIRRVVDANRACSRTSAASSKRPSRTSPASTRRFRRCATRPIIREYAALVASSGRSGSRTRSNARVAEAERQTAADVGARLARQAQHVRAEPRSSSSATSTSCCR